MSLPHPLNPARRAFRATGTALVCSLALAGFAPAAFSAPGSAHVASTWSGSWKTHISPRRVRTGTVGTEFTSTEPGKINTLRLYRTAKFTGARQGSLWSASGEELSKITFPRLARTGWQTARLDTSVSVEPGETYVAGYVSPRGFEPYVRRDLSAAPIAHGSLSLVDGLVTQHAGMPDRSVSRYFPLSPNFIPTNPPTPSPKNFPNASNTGVPTGTALTTYTGPLSITKDGTTINDKTIKGDVLIKADDVTITRSRINGRLLSNFGGSVTVSDSSIDGGNQETFPSVSYTNLSLRRVEVSGGQHSVQCSRNCTVVDSWLHDQYIAHTSAGHVNAFISNGGSGFVLRHNTVHCDVAVTTQNTGCTADVSLFGDFDPISDAVIDNNLFQANSSGASYCLYAGHNPSKRYGSNPSRVRVTDNVFERGPNNKCGIYGPVTSFLPGNGNVWSGNVWQGSNAKVASRG